jgi:hypothetical protein
VDKEFLNQELKVKDSVEPDEIIWENIVFSDKENAGRRSTLYCSGFLFVILSAILFIYINDSYRTNMVLNPPLLCPEYELS